MTLSDKKKDELKSLFNLYDDDCEGKIDGTQVGDVCRAAGIKPTNEMVWKAMGQENPLKKGEKDIKLEEFLPIYEQVSKEKEQGTFADFSEALRAFDKEENGKLLGLELKHILLSLGERLTKEQVEEIMQGVEDGEGMINYEAFIKKVLAGPFPDTD